MAPRVFCMYFLHRKWMFGPKKHFLREPKRQADKRPPSPSSRALCEETAEVFCAAPIILELESGEAVEAKSMDWWAVGVNCCKPNGPLLAFFIKAPNTSSALFIISLSNALEQGPNKSISNTFFLSNLNTACVLEARIFLYNNVGYY